MLVDRLGQEIEVGMWVIKPWDGTFDLGKVIKINAKTFEYEYISGFGPKVCTSVCKVPERCLVVPHIVANYWTALK